MALVERGLAGFAALDLDMLIRLPQGGYYLGGEGIANAIVGSLLLGLGGSAVALAAGCRWRSPCSGSF